MSGTRHIRVSMNDQRLVVMENSTPIAEFDVSTAEKGMGFAEGSHRTPTGRFRICEKIGDGQPSGTIFKARNPVGIWQPGDPWGDDLVLSRILRLDGLDPENGNTLQRFIYIHGTNDEDLIGRPAGHGCVRLRNDDMIELHDIVDEDDSVEIIPATRRRGGLVFVALDSVLTGIDGIAEMARLRGAETEKRYHEIHAAMRSGAIDGGSGYHHWMESIMPDAELCRMAAARCLHNLSPGAAPLLDDIQSHGFTVVMLSRSPMELARPVAAALGIRHVEAPIMDGGHPEYRYPGSNNLSKLEVVRDWSAAMLPARVIVIGRGPDDMTTRPAADLLVACGERHPECDMHVSGLDDRLMLDEALQDVSTT